MPSRFAEHVSGMVPALNVAAITGLGATFLEILPQFVAALSGIWVLVRLMVGLLDLYEKWTGRPWSKRKEVAAVPVCNGDMDGGER